MISGFLDVSPAPRTNDCHLWGHQDTWKRKKTPGTFFGKYYFCKSQNWGNPLFWQFSKKRAPINPEDSYNRILNIVDMGSISIKEHEMEIVWILETLKPRNQTPKTKKPKNQETKKLVYFHVRESPAPRNIPTPTAAPDHLFWWALGFVSFGVSECSKLPQLTFSSLLIYFVAKINAWSKQTMSIANLLKPQNSSCSSRWFILCNLTVHLLSFDQVPYNPKTP